MSGERLRVAAVGYLNARPLYEGLDRAPAASRVRARRAPRPGEVARRMAEDEADVALMPVAAAATIGDLRLVRGCAIGSRGAVRSILVVADRPIDNLEELAVDLSSRTSVVLARLVLRARRRGREPRLVGRGSRRGDRGGGRRARRARHRRSRARDRGPLLARRSTWGSPGGSSRGFRSSSPHGAAGPALSPRRTSASSRPRRPRGSIAAARSPRSTPPAPASRRHRCALTSATPSASISATRSDAVSSASTTKRRTPVSCRGRAYASSTRIAGGRRPVRRSTRSSHAPRRASA